MAHLMTSHARRWLVAALLTGAIGAAASGQTVFFDHFEGNALLPHWGQPLPGEWEHSVSNSQLHVEELLYPSSPFQSTNVSGIFTRITPLVGDFRVRVRMGWEANSIPSMLFSLQNSLAQTIAGFAYFHGSIRARTGQTQWMDFPAPLPGLHDFVVDRVGSQVAFILNGQPLVTLPGSAGDLELFSFVFTSPYPNPGFDPLHIDLVHIVPAPGAAVVLVVAAGMAMSRRRR